LRRRGFCGFGIGFPRFVSFGASIGSGASFPLPCARVATTRLVGMGIRAMHAVAMGACLLVTSSSSQQKSSLFEGFANA
jgi:hypothetical protein